MGQNDLGCLNGKQTEVTGQKDTGNKVIGLLGQKVTNNFLIIGQENGQQNISKEYISE